MLGTSSFTPYLRTILLALLIYMASFSIVCAKEQPLKHILFLNSYQQTMSWSQNILRAINDELDPDNNNMVMHIINMDTKNVFNDEYIKSFASYLKIKTKGLKVDLIIASDNNAYDFLKTYRDEMFPEVPVVFCSVNNLDHSEVKHLKGYTGVEEIIDTPATLSFALKHHPNTKEIFIINDFLTAGRALEEDIKRQLASFQSDVKIRYAGHHSVTELNSQVRALTPGTIVLLGAFYADDNRHFVTGYEHIGPHLVAGSQVPAYAIYDFHVHDGVIGGKVASGYQQGRQAALLAKRILKGEKAENIPVVRSGTTEFIFNYPELKKYSLSVADLPPHSRVINQPISIFHLYFKEILTVSIFIAVLIVIIVLLVLSNRHRRRIAIELSNSEIKLKTIFNQTYEFIGLLSVNGTLLDANQPALDFIQVTKNQVINIPFRDTPWWNHSSSVQNQLQQEINKAARGEVCSFETVHPGNGSEHIFSVTISPVRNNNDEITSLICEGRDITEQKQAQKQKKELEDQLHQTQRLEALGTLAGGIAHDFNNILSAILGFTDLNLINSNCDKKIREHSEHIKLAALRGRDLVQQILTFSRKETEKKEYLELHTIVEDALKLLRKTVPSNITIHTDIDPHTGWVLADQTQLHQIVMNLCTNGWHAIEEEHGQIGVALKAVEITTQDHLLATNPGCGSFAQLEISDSGKGMTEEIRERIFDPFFTTKEQGKGTGLGLAVVHGIIKKLHGHITVTSEPGKGTTFTLWIPLTENISAPASSSTGEIETSVNQEHILWVDDEETLANLGKEFMHALNYQVTATTSADQALKLFCEDPQRYQMVVTDQTMPEMSGIQLSQAILTIRPEMPIILCTGHSNNITAETVAAAGIKGFLIKPLKLVTIAAEIKKLLDD